MKLDRLYNAIKQKLLDINWEEKLCGTFDESYSIFINKLNHSMEGNVPKRTQVYKKQNLYMNRKAMRLKNKKQKLWKKYTLTRCVADYGKFVRIKNELRLLTRTLRRNFETTLAIKSKDSPKQFWSYVKSKLKTKSRIPTLTKSDGTKALSSQEKAEALNDFFGSVYQEESDTDVPPVTKNYSNEPLSTIQITDEMVINKLKSLDPGKSTGPDGWHPYLLQSLADSLCTPLRILFNKSLCEGIVPSQWLEAYITAIFKKGQKSVISNYRPVSITTVICKIMESIIRDHIVSYMTTNKLFTDEQHGFVPKRDCMTNLLIAMEEWTAAIEIGNDIDVIYTDFAKAFDSVPHKRLLIKLKSIGIEDKVLQWIKSFLNIRKHSVCVEGEFSDWVHVNSGIPQGSVLAWTYTFCDFY